ncbi:MAG: S9 family peptidase [Candidatus Hodarchaeota archaeon]
MTSYKEIYPPVALIKPRKYTIHGEEHIDNYYWLREKQNPEVIAYLEAENVYMKAMMKRTEEFQEHLYQEMRNRIKEDDISAPELLGDFLYYSRTEKDKQYKAYYRKKNTPNAPEELLLDGNKLAEGQEYFSLGIFKVSPNQKLLAYSVDFSGSEEYTIYIKNLSTGELYTENIPNTYYDFEWANDNKTFLYSVLNEQKQPDKVYRHILGTDPKNDDLMYQEKDLQFHLSLTKSHDSFCFFITLKSPTTSEVYYLPLDHVERYFQLIHPRQHKLEYYVEHWNDIFLIRSNENAENFKLMQTPVVSPSKDQWKEIVPHRETIMLSYVDVFEHHLVLYEREDGLMKIRLINQDTKEDHYVTFPEPVYMVWRPKPLDPSLVHPEFHTNILRFQYTSLITPNSAFDYNMDNKELSLIKQDEVLGGYDSSKYITERISATGTDGAKIYISLVYQKGIIKNGDNLLLLYGYGSYGYSLDPRFLSSRLSLIDRGVIFAIAHIRGGGEMGRKWYEQGKLLHKKNTFTDFIICAEHLIKEKYTEKGKLAIMGGSAGGLLIGAVINMRPDLFKQAIAYVPFVDVINTMLDPSIPLTVMEYEEWGNPEKKEYYDYMKSYSPYDNIEKKNYPNLLITAGLNDPRVQYWEPAKWIAKLRAMKTDNNRLFLKTEMSSGHAGKSGRFDYLKELALHYAFILDVFGVTT